MQCLKSLFEAPDTDSSERKSGDATPLNSNILKVNTGNLTLSSVEYHVSIPNEVNKCATALPADRLNPTQVAQALGGNVSKSGLTF